MNEPTSHESHWLNERLQRLGSDELDFGVVRSPLRPVVERSDPWQAEMRRHDFSAVLPGVMPESVQDEGAGADRPTSGARVVAVTDVEEDPVGRVQTAVLLARRLAESGSRVLLVDADLRHVGLSRWMPDRDLDAEGLVDILQYGASVHAVQRKGPIENVGIVSVGSYRPDGLDLFDDQGLGRLVVQLRASADVVLVVLPAWLSAERFHPFLVHADAVVVSMHLDRSLAASLEDLLRYLQGLNVSIAGLVTFAGPDASEKRVDELLRETDPWREPEDPEDLEEPSALSRSGRIPSFDDVSEESESQLHRVVVPAAEHVPEPQPRGFRRRPAHEAERSSPVLRITLIAAVVALLGFVGWWGLTQRDHPPARPNPVVQRPSSPVQVDSESTDAGLPAGPTVDLQVDGDSLASEPLGASVSRPDSLLGGEATAQPVDVTEPSLVETVVAEAPEPVEPAPSVAETATTWDVQLRREVGGGYALHLFSFADSTDALSELPRLQRQGWQPVVRGADIPGKGRWFRVLVGRFDDRASALAARDAVGQRAGVDWVGVVRVP